MSYSEDLRSPLWQRKRLEVMAAANFACVACGSTTKTLNVHHTRYIPGNKPWEYDASELRCLCEDCHARCEPTGGEVPPVRSRREVERERAARLGGSAEREVLRVLLHRSEYIPQVVERLGAESFKSAPAREVFVALLEGDGVRTLEDMLLFLSPDAFGLAMELMGELGGLEHSDETIAGGIAAMHERDLVQRMADIDLEMPGSSDDRKDELTREKMALTDELRRLGGQWWKRFR